MPSGERSTVVFEPALVAYLKGYAGLSAEINGRVYPGRLPDPPALPAVTYQRVSTIRVADYDGMVTEASARFQLDCWAETQGQARTVANQLMQALLGYNDDMQGQFVQIPEMSNDFDSYETETGLYRVITEFVIWHEVAQTS